MNWKLPENELPKTNNKNVRCLACVLIEYGDDTCWQGYVDVYFRSDKGWARCEDKSSNFIVLKWIYLEEFERLTDAGKPL